MDGDNLKIALARHGWTGTRLATAMGKTKNGRRTIYDWFAKDKLKRTLLERISTVTNIPVEELTKQTLILNDVDPPQYGVVHHGRIVHNVLKNKGIKIESFSKRMKFTRATAYKRFGEREWDVGELLKAAEILQVPVAQLKGKGEGYRAFEKDIYEQLSFIKKYIIEIHKQLIPGKQY